MRPRARDDYRELLAMRALPTPRLTTARIRRWTGASSSNVAIRSPFPSVTDPPAARRSPPAPAPTADPGSTNRA
jgi:hypothetical protein